MDGTASPQDIRAALSRMDPVALGIWPTPLHRLKRYGASVGHNAFYIKRDDLSGLGMGGNKTRNLEFLLGHALSDGVDTVITGGGLQSNLCRLTAAAAAVLGLRCILVHNDEEPDVLQGNMLLNEMAGAETRFAGQVTEDRRAKLMETTAESLEARGERAFVVHNGGSTPLGALGFVSAALELYEQVTAAGIDLRHVGMVGAMGGTAAGFVAGTALLGGPWHVHVISVEYPRWHLANLVQQLAEGALELLDMKPAKPLESVMTIYDDYLGPGYAIPTPMSLLAQEDLARLEGIFLELVYTSKTLGGLGDLVRRGVVPAGEAVCFWHTGGDPALFAQASELQDFPRR